MRINTEFGRIAWYFFLTILNFFDGESRDSTFRNKKWRNQYGRPKLKY